MGLMREAKGLVTVGPLDHRDAIRGRDPLQQLGGLVLDFVTKVISSPMALFLVLDDQRNYKLVEVKAEPILTADPESLAREYLDSVATVDPIFDMAWTATHAKIACTDHLAAMESFPESKMAVEFMGGNGLGPLVALILGERAAAQRCVVLLLRSSDEPEFGDREKAFLRNAAPLLTQSYYCAIGMNGGSHRAACAGADELTPREWEIARLVADGLHNNEIGATLHIAPGTVKCHIRNIYAKLGVESRIRLAQALGLPA